MGAKRYQIAIRLEEETYQRLDELASQRKLSLSAIARICLDDGVAGFDRRYEILRARMDGLQHEVQETATLARTAIAAVLLLQDNRDDDIETAKAKLLGNLLDAVSVEKLIKDRLAAVPPSQVRHRRSA